MRFSATTALAMMLAAAPALAATTVIGSNRARVCYLDAERERTSELSVANCTEALKEDALSKDDTVATYVNRGILLARLDELQQAIADYDRAIALDPEEAEAYLNKGAALFKTGGWREALPLFDTALAKRTDRPEVAYFARGLTHELGGDLKAAYADLKRANELAPEWELPRRELARYSVRARG